MKININQFLFAVSMALDTVEGEVLGAAENHSKRVACLSMLIGEKLGFSREEKSDLAAYAVLHDNALTEYVTVERQKGNEVLLKENPENIEYHCNIGDENLSVFPFFEKKKGIIKYHHENYDGSGLFGVSGENIPLMARILRITDQVDVSFKLSVMDEEKKKKVIRHIKMNENRLYDPYIAEILISILDNGIFYGMKNSEIEASLMRVTPVCEKEMSFDEIIHMSRLLAHIIDYKSPFTLRHSTGIAEKAKEMAEFYGYKEDMVKQFYIAAYLHDIGKLAVPDVLLEKQGKLTENEFEVIKKHVYYTHKILSTVDGFALIEQWASSHHERLDGKGYFQGKTKGQLDFPSRLLACIDIYQALVEERPYRKGMEHDKAIHILNEMAGEGAVDRSIVQDLDRYFAGKMEE